jgi:hypothetical protein
LVNLASDVTLANPGFFLMYVSSLPPSASTVTKQGWSRKWKTCAFHGLEGVFKADSGFQSIIKANSPLHTLQQWLIVVLQQL